MIKGPVSAREGLQWPADLVALYSAEHLGLVRAAFLICGSVASAEDAVHDAVTRVVARWDGVDNGRSYLYVSAVNAARDSSRRDERSRRLFASRTLVEDAAVLRYFLDWDDDEIAQHFDVRPTTVRSWVHRGIGRLRKELDR